MQYHHRPAALLAVALLCAGIVVVTGCQAPDPMRIQLEKSFDPKGFELAQLMDNYEPLIAEKWQLDPIAEHEEATVCVSQVTGNIPPHYFKRHDRVICILNGKGRAEIGGTRYLASFGTTLIVPKGTRYRYVSDPGQKYFALCMFSPRYTGKDVKFIKQKK